MSTTDEVFKTAEIRVAAYTDLTAEQGRALYAAYVKEKGVSDGLAARIRALEGENRMLKGQGRRLHAEKQAEVIRELLGLFANGRKLHMGMVNCYEARLEVGRCHALLEFFEAKEPKP